MSRDTLAAIEASGSMVSGSAVLAASYEGKPYGVPRYTATNGVTFRTGHSRRGRHRAARPDR